MSVELLYTSAAQGLKQGSRGFCTVLSTAGMPLNLATRLESLSAYRHVFPPSHPDAAQNPVSFSHLRINVGGRPLSILSRISDYGIDYSQRTNKLAHHVVLEGVDLVPAGPAWVMSQTSIMRSRWDGQCATPSSGPAVPPSNQLPRVCLRWSGLCSEAGWGGVVAEAFTQPPGKPLWIVFSLTQSAELLMLINESIALLPVDQRWQATFSTYATNLPPDADCKVRCVLAGTDDARLAPARGKVIDLSKPLPPIAPTAVTPFVIAARNGTALPGASQPPRPSGSAKPQPPVARGSPDQLAEQLFEANESTLAVATQQALESQARSDLNLARSPTTPPAVKRKDLSAERQDADVHVPTARNLKWAMIGLSVAASLLLVSTAVLLLQRKSVEVATQSTEEKDEGSSVLPTLETADPNPTLDEAVIAQDNQTQAEAPAVDILEPVTHAPGNPAAAQSSDAQAAGAEDQKPNGLAADGKTEDGTTINEPINADSKDAASSSEVEETYPVLVAQIQASKLLKGDVCVRLEIQDFTDISFKEARFSHEKEGRGYKFEGSLVAVGRPPHIKYLECIRKSFTIIVEVESKDKELKERASKIRDGWTNVTKAVNDWQNALGKSHFPRPQALELVIEKPAEPKSTSSVQDLQQQLNALLERAKQVVEKLAEHEADRAAKSSVEEAKAHFQRYREGLKKFQEHIASLQLEIDSLTKIDREFDTGIIMYVGKLESGKMIDQNELKRGYRLNEKSAQKETETETGNQSEKSSNAQPKPAVQ